MRSTKGQLATVGDPPIQHKLSVLRDEGAPTAQLVLGITERIVSQASLTTIMVAHNMNDAIRMGNCLIMMSEGEIIYDTEADAIIARYAADILASDGMRREEVYVQHGTTSVLDHSLAVTRT